MVVNGAKSFVGKVREVKLLHRPRVHDIFFLPVL